MASTKFTIYDIQHRKFQKNRKLLILNKLKLQFFSSKIQFHTALWTILYFFICLIVIQIIPLIVCGDERHQIKTPFCLFDWKFCSLEIHLPTIKFGAQLTYKLGNFFRPQIYSFSPKAQKLSIEILEFLLWAKKVLCLLFFIRPVLECQVWILMPNDFIRVSVSKSKNFWRIFC